MTRQLTARLKGILAVNEKVFHTLSHRHVRRQHLAWCNDLCSYTIYAATIVTEAKYHHTVQKSTDMAKVEKNDSVASANDFFTKIKLSSMEYFRT